MQDIFDPEVEVVIFGIARDQSNDDSGNSLVISASYQEFAVPIHIRSSTVCSYTAVSRKPAVVCRAAHAADSVCMHSACPQAEGTYTA